MVALAQTKIKGAPPPSVGMGRVAKLTGLEILRRMHVVFRHPSLPVLLATLMRSKDINAHIITKADIEQYVCARSVWYLRDAELRFVLSECARDA